MMKEMLAMNVDPGGKVYDALEESEELLEELLVELLVELEELLEVLGRVTEVVAVEV